MKIMSRLSWDCVLKWERTENILRELNFGCQILLFQTRKICAELLKHVIVYSDASNVAVIAYNIKLKNSTWRELRAIEQTLVCFQASKTLKWFTDNQSCVRIVQNRSMKMELQRMAMNIFSVCVQKGIIIDIQWIPRQENVKADYISNIIDYEDWGVTNEFFQFMN